MFHVRYGASRGTEEEHGSGTGRSPRPRGMAALVSSPSPARGPRAARSHGSCRRSRSLEGCVFAKTWLGEALAALAAAVGGAGGGQKGVAGLGWGSGRSRGQLRSADPVGDAGQQRGGDPRSPCSHSPLPSTAVVRAFKCGCAF